MSKETLKTLIASKKSPEMAAFFRLEAEFRQKLDAMLKEAKAEIKEMSEDKLFSDLEPAKKIAEKVADEKLSEHKAMMNEKVSSILAKMSEKEEEMYARMESEMAKTHELFMEQCEEALGVTKDELALMKEAHNAEMTRITSNLEAMRGPKGEQGDSGMDGKDGANGMNGKDGSPDTPDQVMSKAIASPKLFSIAKIFGLAEELANIKNAVNRSGGKKGGGGGMGQPQHEKFTVGASTTTIQTAYKIGAGGRAIFHCAYQGQIIRYGEHYTVGSDFRTLTLTFAPDDSTTIEIAYVR
jgi:hypothetical protein